MQSLLSPPHVIFNFSEPHPLHRAVWQQARQRTDAGTLLFNAATQEIDIGDPSQYFSYQSKPPTRDWYLPVPTSCPPSDLSSCPLMDGYGRVSPGWSLSVWVKLNAFEAGSAHLFSALQTGWTLRVSVDAATGLLEVVDNNYAYPSPLVCRSDTPVPLAIWTLVSVTQWNEE